MRADEEFVLAGAGAQLAAHRPSLPDLDATPSPALAVGGGVFYVPSLRCELLDALEGESEDLRGVADAQACLSDELVHRRPSGR